jgi:hypothetical protein
MMPPLGFHVTYGIFVQYEDTIIPLQFSLVTIHHESKLSKDFLQILVGERPQHPNES